MDKQVLTISGKEYKIRKMKRTISARFVKFGRVLGGFRQVSTGYDIKQYLVLLGFEGFRQVSQDFAGFRQ